MQELACLLNKEVENKGVENELVILLHLYMFIAVDNGWIF